MISHVVIRWQCWSVCRGGFHRSGDVRHAVVVASCAVWFGPAECWLVGPALERCLSRCLLWWESELVTGTRRVCLNKIVCSAVAKSLLWAEHCITEGLHVAGHVRQ